ncbi:MAG TPA: DUF47 family protein [Verrucomicrobiota bacterium]|nr:DUF47 family protein [Verrucomicrobiota bacterium]HNU50578.1 DUF47 family protein [Verrucomicrobiota bacterium]
MFSLQALFGKADRFHRLLEASAEEAHESVRFLVELLKSPAPAQLFDEVALTRRKEKKIAEQIGEELVRTFITGLEREDIEALSHALYKIPKSVEKFAERYLLAGPHLKGFDFTRQAEMMEKAAGTVAALVKQLADVSQVERVKELNDRLQYIEGEADKLMVELLRELYGGRLEPLQVVIVKDLYELMEKVIDRCRDAGNIVLQIVLKNS